METGKKRPAKSAAPSKKNGDPAATLGNGGETHQQASEKGANAADAEVDHQPGHPCLLSTALHLRAPTT